MDSSVSVNIAILPPKDVRAKAIELSRKVAQQIPTEFALVDGKFYPHITITRAKNAEDALIAEEILENTPPLSFLADKIIIGNLGDHGTINKILEEFSLS